MKGLVVKNTGSWYTVRTDDGQLLDCKIKGNFRLKGIRTTNPVAVGDRVEVSLPPTPSDRGGAWITEIEDRRNYIIRKSINLSKQSHIIAANVDQAFLIVTVANPQTSTTFIDRFLASAEAYRVPVVLIFNKTDLLDEDALRYQQAVVNLYETIGYECRQVSAETGEGIDDLRPMLEGKITLLSGNSGVGKSTLINRLVPGANLRTAELSDAYNMGMHTTTFSEMIALAPLSSPEGDTIEAPSGAVGGAVNWVLRDINLIIPKGKTIAIVGQSGSGKSTMVDLIPRYYDVQEGEVLIDGINVKDLGIHDLRQLIGNVNQEAILFNDTFRNNISFGVDNATDKQIAEAAKIANAYDFIMQSEQQFETNIGDRGGRLSGGQRQRVSIARAILKNPPILILDEATSALDTESERLVQDALERLMKTRTTVAIAHRLSTIKNADEICVLHEGQIVERGTHDELLNIDGYYKKLNDMQSL